MNLPLDRDHKETFAAQNDALQLLLRCGAAMLSAGDTAFQVRRWMNVMAHRMGFDALSVILSLSTVVASARRHGVEVTMLREIGPPGINAWRIGALERFARDLTPGMAPDKIAAKLREIEAAPPRYSAISIAFAIGLTCGAFAFLNGGGVLEVTGATVGSFIGQWLRSRLLSRQLNQYGVTAVSAVAAAGVYGLIAAATSRIDFGFAHHTSGLMSSILYLLPGFPLVTSLFDMLQHQGLSAISRLAHAVTIILAAAFGLAIVTAIVGFDDAAVQPLELAESTQLILGGIASFVSACGLAMLFNSSARAVLAVGILALGANEVRLGLNDAGMMLAPATFFGSLTVGFAAEIVYRYLDESRVTIAVPAIIIMMPGAYALQAVLLFHQGQTVEALQAAALAGFVIGALAAGLAVVPFLSRE